MVIEMFEINTKLFIYTIFEWLDQDVQEMTPNNRYFTKTPAEQNSTSTCLIILSPNSVLSIHRNLTQSKTQKSVVCVINKTTWVCFSLSKLICSISSKKGLNKTWLTNSIGLLNVSFAPGPCTLNFIPIHWIILHEVMEFCADSHWWKKPVRLFN